jgi:hypothetical protein
MTIPLTAALRWQRENPPVPTNDEYNELSIRLKGRAIIEYWIRRMYDAPEPEAPEAIKDLIDYIDSQLAQDRMRTSLVEAYRRGKAEVPTEIKDLLMIPPGKDGHRDGENFCAEINKRMTECYRRGVEEGRKG